MDKKKIILGQLYKNNSALLGVKLHQTIKSWDLSDTQQTLTSLEQDGLIKTNGEHRRLTMIQNSQTVGKIENVTANITLEGEKYYEQYLDRKNKMKNEMLRATIGIIGVIIGIAIKALLDQWQMTPTQDGAPIYFSPQIQVFHNQDTTVLPNTSSYSVHIMVEKS